MKKIFIVIVSAVIILIAFLAVNENKTDRNSDVIRIGAPLSLTGMASVEGNDIKLELDLARADLEKNGIKIEIIYEDDGTDPKRTISSVQKLSSVDNVDALVGLTWSFLLDATAPVVEELGLVVFSPANTSEFTNENEYTFYGALKNELKKEPIENWLIENNKTKVALVVEKSGWGVNNMDVFSRAVSNTGADVVVADQINFGSESETIPTVVAKIVDSNADVVITTGNDDLLIILIKKLQEQKNNIPIIVANDAIVSIIDRDLVKSENIYHVTTKVSTDFIEKFENFYGVKPGNYADKAYDGLMVLIDGILNKKEGEELSDYLRDKSNYQGFSAKFNFDQNGDISDGVWYVKRLY